MRGFIICLHFLASARLIFTARDMEAEKTSIFWKNLAQEQLEQAIEAQKLNKRVAKNVIIFLGDGMGVSTVTAGRILKGQMAGESGEDYKLAMDKLPHVALSKTYSVDKQVADSASTATAYLCGVKTNFFMIGVNAATEKENCLSSKGNEVDSVLVDSHKAGKSTGVVTTTRINHATPAGTYAHVASRTWYGDADLPKEAKKNGCKDIAMQFYESSDMITVALGGGRKYFQPDNTTDPEYTSKNNKREDGNDLLGMWKNKMSEAGLEAKYVWNKSQFDAVDASSTDRLLGLFEPKDMRYEAERLDDEAGEPSIADMTEKAIEILRKNDNGYFLLVEGGRIDHGHHAANAFLSLHDLVAFDDAIEKAVEMTSEEDTLIIVTADHSHVFTIGGYSGRGNDIFGLAPLQDDPELALDSKPYTTLLYGNGPGYQGHYFENKYGYMQPILTEGLGRKNITDVDTTIKGYLQQSAVPLPSESHGGEDVPIFASGPMAHLLHGVHEQNYIAHVMRYASCVGEDKSHCTPTAEQESKATAGDMSKRESNDTVSYLGNQISVEDAETTLQLQFVFLWILAIIIIFLLIVVFKNYGRLKKEESRSVARHESSVPLTDKV